MTTLKVTSEQLQSVSSQLQAGKEDVEQQLTSMETKVRSLVDADWSGAASDSFRDLWDKWHTGAAQVRDALQGISTMLNETAKAYQETEDALATQLRGGH
ncbi:MAG: WXG100 family type VII secretion target [Acidimicrobiia bacterium]